MVRFLKQPIHYDCLPRTCQTAFLGSWVKWVKEESNLYCLPRGNRFTVCCNTTNRCRSPWIFFVSPRTLGKKRWVPFSLELCSQVDSNHHSAPMLTLFNRQGGNRTHDKSANSRLLYHWATCQQWGWSLRSGNTLRRYKFVCAVGKELTKPTVKDMWGIAPHLRLIWFELP